MRKTLSLILALLLVVLSTGTVLAKPANGKGWEKQFEKTFTGDDQNGKRVKERLKKSVQDKYHARHSEQGQKENGFSDTNNHWAVVSIREMTAIGLFSGYPDGSFKPDQELTQAEALSLIMRLIDLGDEDADEEFIDANNADLNDVPAWARHHAARAAKKGIIKLNRFHSAVQASRAQVAVMIAKALGLEPVDVSDPFNDGIQISQEDLGYILALYQEGIMTGDTKGNFNPNSCITRAQMASILQRLLDEDDDEKNDEESSEILSVSLPKTAVVEEGKSITLVATVKYSGEDGDEDISWSSDNTALATVDDAGVVTAAQEKTGTVNIKASVTQDSRTLSALCKVTVVDDIDAASGELSATGITKKMNGKVYQEYDFKVNDEKISLAADKVKSISLQKDSGTPVLVAPTSDTSLWFDVQSETADYTVTVVQKDDDVYEAVLKWTAPIAVTAAATGETREESGYTYAEYAIDGLDLSSFTYMYQIKPGGQVVQWGATGDVNLWIKTTDQVSGTQIGRAHV